MRNSSSGKLQATKLLRATHFGCKVSKDAFNTWTRPIRKKSKASFNRMLDKILA